MPANCTTLRRHPELVSEEMLPNEGRLSRTAPPERIGCGCLESSVVGAYCLTGRPATGGSHAWLPSWAHQEPPVATPDSLCVSEIECL